MSPHPISWRTIYNIIFPSTRRSQSQKQFLFIIINILTAIVLAPGGSSPVHIYREHYIYNNTLHYIYNNNNNIYLLQLDCHPVAVVILRVYKI